MFYKYIIYILRSIQVLPVIIVSKKKIFKFQAHSKKCRKIICQISINIIYSGKLVNSQKP